MNPYAWRRPFMHFLQASGAYRGVLKIRPCFISRSCIPMESKSGKRTHDEML
jgi:hypothetical protein